MGAQSHARRDVAMAARVLLGARDTAVPTTRSSWGRRSARNTTGGIEEKPSAARDLRLLVPSLVAWATAAVTVRLGTGDAFLMGAGLGFAALMVMGVVWIRKRAAPFLRVVLISASVATMVCLPASAKLDQQLPPVVVNAIEGDEHVTAVVEIEGDARKATSSGVDGSVRFLVDARLIEFTHQGQRFTAATPVVVYGGSDWSRASYGQVVATAGKLTGTDPGQRAKGLLIAATGPDLVDKGSPTPAVDAFRTNFLEVAARTGAPDHGLMAGMVIGARSAVSEDLAAKMRATGLTHLTAVSGANCSYVLAFVFLGCRAFQLPRWVAAIAGVVALAAFVLLVRPEPSVLRAAVMGSIGVLAVLTGRGRLSLTLLLLSITVLMTADPWLSGEYAFILSVAATSGLVLAGPMLAAALGSLLPVWLAQLIAVPLSAQLFCAPVLVLLQPSMPLYSLPANMLAAPAVPFITILGMIAVILATLIPVAALPFAALAGWGAAGVGAIAQVFSAAPLATLPWLPGGAGAALAAAGSLGLLALVFWRNRVGAVISVLAKKLGSSAPGRGLRSGLAWIAGGCVIGLAAVWLWIGPQGAPQFDWVLASCDVGQGDGFVVRTGASSAMVFDAGPDPVLIKGCLDLLNVDTVELLVLTHFHEDHFGGVQGVFADRAVKRLAYSTSEEDLPALVVEAAQAEQIEPETLGAGQTGNFADVEWTVLWPTPGAVPSAENDASAVVLVTLGSGRADPLEVLFTGDIEEHAAATMLATNPRLAHAGVDVLKVAHHGARNGGSRMIAELSPPIALISAGRNNDYGHPHPATLQALEAEGAHTVRTDQLGSFVLVRKSGGVLIRPLR